MWSSEQQGTETIEIERTRVVPWSPQRVIGTIGNVSTAERLLALMKTLSDSDRASMKAGLAALLSKLPARTEEILRLRLALNRGKERLTQLAIAQRCNEGDPAGRTDAGLIGAIERQAFKRLRELYGVPPDGMEQELWEAVLMIRDDPKHSGGYGSLKRRLREREIKTTRAAWEWATNADNGDVKLRAALREALQLEAASRQPDLVREPVA